MVRLPLPTSCSGMLAQSPFVPTCSSLARIFTGVFQKGSKMW